MRYGKFSICHFSILIFHCKAAVNVPAWSCLLALHYPAASDHFISPVKNRGLTGRDGTLRLIKNNSNPVDVLRHDGGRRRCVTIAHPRLGPHRLCRWIKGYPIDTGGGKLSTQQLFLIPHHYSIGR